MPAGRAGRPRHPDVLTPGEWRVLNLVRHGLSRREIADRLGTSEDAVRYHIRNIRAKVNKDTQQALRHWVGYPRGAALTRIEEDTMAALAPGIERIGQLALRIRDVERATRFYREVLGLEHLYSFGDLVFFDCAGTRLYLHRVGDADWAPGSVVYFAVPDINSAYRGLSDAGVRFAGAPHLIHRHESGTEEWMAFFDDGEGNMLAVMSQVSPAGDA